MEMNDYVQYGILIVLLIRMFYVEYTMQKMQSVIVWFCDSLLDIPKEGADDDIPAPDDKKKEENSEERRKE